MKKLNYSIVIPAHNSSAFIDTLLKSIPYRHDVEVILVDDHSSDYGILEEKVAQYPLVKLLRNTGGQGAGNARQIGLGIAKGRWILFADSDDKFADTFDETLDQYAESDADIILLMTEAVRLDGGVSDRCDYYHYLFGQYNNGAISSLELSCRLTNIWAKLYRRDAVARASFQDTLVANDVQYAAQAAFYTRKKIIVDDSAPFYILTERPGSITTSRHKKLSKYIKRSRVRIANDLWLHAQFRGAGEQRVRLRRYESVFRKLLKKGSYEVKD